MLLQYIHRIGTALMISELNDKRWVPWAKDTAIRDSSGGRVWIRLAGEGCGAENRIDKSLGETDTVQRCD